MIIDRKVIVPKSPIPVVELHQRCLDCENCTGICIDMIQMKFLPEVLEGQREIQL